MLLRFGRKAHARHLCALAPFLLGCALHNAQAAEPDVKSQAPAAAEAAKDQGSKKDQAAAKKEERPRKPPPVVERNGEVVNAGTNTRGGLVEGTRIIRVHNLDDDGRGSLRAALRKSCPCVIVFDIGGVIDLKEDLRISNPHTTIAGQTAPYPGIFLRGAKLRIAASDIVVQHISVSPVTPDMKVHNEIDAITISACSECDPEIKNIRLENVSASWSTDEVIGLWGDGLSKVTIRNSLIAEGLDEAGHRKKNHSMGMLIGGRVEAIEVTGNLFASNTWRNPVVGAGASAYVGNNYVYNPGESALHVYGDKSDRKTLATFVGNIVKRGPDTDVDMVAVQVPTEFDQPSKGAEIFLSDNHCCTGFAVAAEELGDLPSLVKTPPVSPASWKPLPADYVWAWVSRNAGSRPRERSANDSRILDYVRMGGGKIIDNPKEVGGYLEIKQGTKTIGVPRSPFTPPPPLINAETRLEAWLCLRHREVGGPPTAECPHDERTLRMALAVSNPD